VNSENTKTLLPVDFQTVKEACVNGRHDEESDRSDSEDALPSPQKKEQKVQKVQRESHQRSLISRPSSADLDFSAENPSPGLHSGSWELPFEDHPFHDTILNTVEPTTGCDWEFMSGAMAASGPSEPTSHTSALTQRIQDAFQTPDPTPKQLDTLQSQRPNSHIWMAERPSSQTHNATMNLDNVRVLEYLNTPCSVPSTQLAFGDAFRRCAGTPTPGQRRQRPEPRGPKASGKPFWRGMGVNNQGRGVANRGHRKGM